MLQIYTFRIIFTFMVSHRLCAVKFWRMHLSYCWKFLFHSLGASSSLPLGCLTKLSGNNSVPSLHLLFPSSNVVWFGNTFISISPPLSKLCTLAYTPWGLASHFEIMVILFGFLSMMSGDGDTCNIWLAFGIFWMLLSICNCLQNDDEDMVYMYNAYLHKLITCFLSDQLARDKVSWTLLVPMLL